jgi:NADH:ubiquinone oxidoreductase subunit 4 (subunit M)
MREVDSEITRMEEVENSSCAEFQSEMLKRRGILWHLEVDGMTVLISLINKYDTRLWIGFIWLKIRTNDGVL